MIKNLPIKQMVVGCKCKYKSEPFRAIMAVER